MRRNEEIICGILQAKSTNQIEDLYLILANGKKCKESKQIKRNQTSKSNCYAKYHKLINW